MTARKTVTCIIFGRWKLVDMDYHDMLPGSRLEGASVPIDLLI